MVAVAGNLVADNQYQIRETPRTSNLNLGKNEQINKIVFIQVFSPKFDQISYNSCHEFELFKMYDLT